MDDGLRHLGDKEARHIAPRVILYIYLAWWSTLLT